VKGITITEKGKEEEEQEELFKKIVEIEDKKMLITFKVPEQTKKKLLRLALKLDISISQIVREAIKRLIEEEMEQEIAIKDGRRVRVEIRLI